MLRGSLARSETDRIEGRVVKIQEIDPARVGTVRQLLLLTTAGRAPPRVSPFLVQCKAGRLGAVLYYYFLPHVRRFRAASARLGGEVMRKCGGGRGVRSVVE
jgi:hypothetical protein